MNFLFTFSVKFEIKNYFSIFIGVLQYIKVERSQHAGDAAAALRLIRKKGLIGNRSLYRCCNRRADFV